jgi:uncharacterized protein (TIGR03086 family)
MDVSALDASALAAAGKIIANVHPDQLALATPCAQWRLDALLSHMVGQNYGFAAAIRGATTDRTVWRNRPVGDDPAGAYDASVDELTAAFAENGRIETIWMPEVRDTEPFPAPVAISFHVLDLVVHGWDVARTIGVAADFDEDLLAVAWPVAARVEAGKHNGPGKAFDYPVAAPAEAPLLDRIVATLGRRPDWTPAA